MDTETLGLNPKAPIWEFAAIRRDPSSPHGSSFIERRYHCFIKHRPGRWLKQLPPSFQADYKARYREHEALSRRDAIAMIAEATVGAHIVGAVPSFDTIRITRLMQPRWWERLLRISLPIPSWHYHLVDVETMAVGYLCANAKTAGTPWNGNPPHKSDALSKALGVDPEQYHRHSAMGDVEWVRDQYDAIVTNV